MKYFIVFLTFILAFNESNSEEITLKDLKENYSINDSLSFKLINHSSDTLDIIISIEMLIDNNWSEIISDIFHPREKFVRIIKIFPLDDKAVSFKIYSVLEPWIPKYNKYRIKISRYIISQNKYYEVLLSNPFTIN